jgi:hypothetical protein
VTLRRTLTGEQGIGALMVCAAGVLVTGLMRRRAPDDPPHPV